MLSYIRKVVQYKKNEEGATAVEYGLLVAAIAAVIVVIVFALGSFVNGAFKKTCDAISGNVTAAPAATCS